MQNLPHTLALLAQQTRLPDAVYLGIPSRSRRNNEKYPPVPPALRAKYPNFHVVEIDRDYGSVCKIMGAAAVEKDPDTLVVTIDDDYEAIPPRLLETFETCVAQQHRRDHHVVWALRGHQIGRFPFQHAFAGVTPSWKFLPRFIAEATVRDVHTGHPLVQVLYGVGGVCYPRRVLPTTTDEWNTFFKYYTSPHLRMHDDVWLSAYLSEHDIKTYRVPDARTLLVEFTARKDARGLSNDTSFNREYLLAFADAKEISDGAAFANHAMEKIENPASTLTFWTGLGALGVVGGLVALRKAINNQKKSPRRRRPSPSPLSSQPQ